MSASTPNITIPANLLPSDGRFGSGPSKVRIEALDALAATGSSYLGTSHRQPRVKDMVARLQDGMRTFFSLPEDWDVIVGNGGATLLWDALTFGFIEQRSQHLSFGEFGSKFAGAAKAAPHLADPMVIESPTGDHPELVSDESIDTYCYPHNETSTGVAMPVTRVPGARGLMCVDATSAAGGLRWSPDHADLYYFSPQKCFSSDGGLYIALAAPAAAERIETIAASGRWIPAGLSLKTALENSRNRQTYNTPALATIFLAVQTVEWLNEFGGLEFAATRCDTSAAHIFDWAEKNDATIPFVADPAKRSHVVATIDLVDGVDATLVAKVLRHNGIVDTEAYRGLGRNQLRIALFPAIDPEDVKALTGCIDYVLAAISA